jgi:hypothetical protein
MSKGSDSEWITSRKIVVKSLTRHFAPWKSRLFVLDRKNALLGIRSSSDAISIVSLSSPSFVVQRHEYSVDSKYLLTIKYVEMDSAFNKEVVMKFDNEVQLQYWEQVYNYVDEYFVLISSAYFLNNFICILVFSREFD